MKQSSPVVIVGAGHAGLEAAHAAARMGATVVLVTHRRDRIGEMSCNPAIGGIGKGHLVREIDALDGLMGRLGDAAAIHYRLLNASKGPAVYGARAQCDRSLYRAAAGRALGEMRCISVVEAAVEDLAISHGRVIGVVLSDGATIDAASVVLTTGTFLGGVIHTGDRQRSGGRDGDPASKRLAERLRTDGLPVGRLKTGTPPRLDGRTIDWGRLEKQISDADPVFLSMTTTAPVNRQVACAITHTNPRCHEIIQRNIARSAMFGGGITGTGPRYCPSIEDKVVRFADKSAHQIFLEPEGLEDNTVYPNGISTSLPEAVQAEFIASIVGLENVRLIRPGYAIEYDYVSPTALDATLAVKGTVGLFLAGQINGTTGYEEAAAQGLVAGLNAALSAKGRPCVTFSRSESYIGVLIDDLITKGVSEPYRMFTSRAEFRLTLRPDNADLRLTPKGIALGCVGDDRKRHFELRSERVSAGRDAFLSPGEEAPENEALTSEDLRTLRAEVLYAGYTDRQERQARQLACDESVGLPSCLVYETMPGLSRELRGKLATIRPQTLAQASRIEGMTPAALLLIAGAAKRHEMVRA